MKREEKEGEKVKIIKTPAFRSQPPPKNKRKRKTRERKAGR